jgi:3-oxoacyl-[acyl-carrier-protein] synthase-1
MTGAAITAVGCHSPVGIGVDQTCASIRAGIARLQTYDDYVALGPELSEAEPEPISYAPASSLPGGADLERRLGALAAHAVADLAPRSGLTRADFRDTHVLLALPENSREGIADLDGDRMIHGLRKASSLALRAGQRFFHDGHVAALLALEAAGQILSEDPASRCLVVAVDSNVLDANLDRLDQAWRLKSQRNVDGFIPGEAGVAILVEGAEAVGRRGATVLARIGDVGKGEETNPASSDAQSTATGLSAAIDGACPDAAEHPIRWVVCDLNGESYRGHEWGVALTRLAARLQSPAIWHPAENTGDVGAASAALHVCIASSAFSRGYAPAERALVWCASDSHRRAACVIAAPGTPQTDH